MLKYYHVPYCPFPPQTYQENCTEYIRHEEARLRELIAGEARREDYSPTSSAANTPGSTPQRPQSNSRGNVGGTYNPNDHADDDDNEVCCDRIARSMYKSDRQACCMIDVQ